MLSATGLTVRYAGVTALRDVSIALEGGRVHALVGENGAGKSTLMKVLAGAVAPDEGTLTLDGVAVRFRSPKEAQGRGVRMIQQELSLVPALTVAENIALGAEPARFGVIDRVRLRAQAVALLGALGEGIDPDAQVGSLALAHRQMVEIAKALTSDGRSALGVLILDEPTAILSARETDALFAQIRALRARGVATVYCSHRLDEIDRIADDVTVLRDGARVGGGPVGSLPRDVLIPLMVGRALGRTHWRSEGEASRGRVLLSVSGLSTALDVRRRERLPSARHEAAAPTGSPAVADASFELRAGEIVGVVGLVGAGRSTLALALMGAVRRTAGTVTLDGEAFAPRSPREAIRAGVGFVPEDRKESALIAHESVRVNTTLARLRALARRGVVDRRVEREATDRWMGALAVRAPSRETPVAQLSGGNQQKVVLARWLVPGESPLKVLIVDEPTRGVDVGARAEIYGVLRTLAGAGAGILVISSDLEEALMLCDRVLVMRAGRLVGELAGEARTAERAVALMVPTW
jgi:ribose transport system ATP-binding protein